MRERERQAKPELPGGAMSQYQLWEQTMLNPSLNGGKPDSVTSPEHKTYHLRNGAEFVVELDHDNNKYIALIKHGNGRREELETGKLNPNIQ